MNRQGGYTVIETTLAMAISATALILVAGLAVNAGNKRFQNTMNEVKSFVQSQYDEVRTNINSRLGGKVSNISGCDSDGSSSATGNSKCYVVGRLIDFGKIGTEGDASTISSQYVIAIPNNPAAWPDTTKSGLDNLKASVVTLRVIDASDFTGGADAGTDLMRKMMGDGSEITKVWNIAGSSVENQQMAVIHSPVDGNIITDIYPSVTGRVLTLGTSNNGSGVVKAVAIKNGGTGYGRGLLCIQGGDNASNMAINYNSQVADGDTSGIKTECDNLWKEVE